MATELLPPRVLQQPFERLASWKQILRPAKHRDWFVDLDIKPDGRHGGQRTSGLAVFLSCKGHADGEMWMSVAGFISLVWIMSGLMDVAMVNSERKGQN